MERAKARAVVDGVATLRAELSAAMERLAAARADSSSRSEARQQLEERRRQGEAIAASARQETDARIAAELTQGDKRCAVVQRQLQQQNEERDLLRARLAVFHESLCKLPPALQQRFFAPADDADVEAGSGFASALSAFIDDEV